MDSNKIEDLNDVLAHSSYLIKFLAYYCKFYILFLANKDSDLNA